MAKTPEQKIADSLAGALDSLRLNIRLAAYFTINALTDAGQERLFQFMMSAIDIMAKDDMTDTYITANRARRNIISLAIVKAVEDEGYYIE